MRRRTLHPATLLLTEFSDRILLTVTLLLPRKDLKETSTPKADESWYTDNSYLRN